MAPLVASRTEILHAALADTAVLCAAATARFPAALVRALSRQARNRRMIAMALVTGAREKAARTQDQHEEERDMPGEDLPFRIDGCADRLRNANDYPARQRPPRSFRARR